MNNKILAVIVTLIGFSISVRAQKAIGSVEGLVEQRAVQQRAAEKADPTLSKTRPGRISTKEEKVAMQKSRKTKHQEIGKAMKKMNNKKMKRTTSKNSPKQPTKGTTKQTKQPKKIKE